jgi:hypothetical protein
METNTPATDGAAKPQKSAASVVAVMAAPVVLLAILIDVPPAGEMNFAPGTSGHGREPEKVK